MITLFILGAITGVAVYIIFHDVAPVPGVMSSLYRKNLTPQDIVSANPPVRLAWQDWRQHLSCGSLCDDSSRCIYTRKPGLRS